MLDLDIESIGRRGRTLFDQGVIADVFIHDVAEFIADQLGGGNAFAEGQGDVAQFRLRRECALRRQSSGDDFDLGRAEGIEAVHDGGADLNFGGLAVGVS